MGFLGGEGGNILSTELYWYMYWFSVADRGMPVRRCVLHIADSEGATTGDVKTFTEASLEKCKHALEIRKTMTNSKYSAIVVPDEVSVDSGYHSKCYKNYTAVSVRHVRVQSEIPSTSSVPAETDNLSRSTPSSAMGVTSSPITGIFEPKCIFCNQVEKKHKGMKQDLSKCETANFENNIKSYAEILKDNLLTKVREVDFTAKEVRYHGICRIDYQRRAEIKKEQEKKQSEVKTSWHEVRSALDKAFTALCDFIQLSIIQNEEVHLLKRA